jgi:hypothetical protein
MEDGIRDETTLTGEEVTTMLADAEGMDPDELERRAEAIEIEPPGEAAVVEESANRQT